MNAESLKTQFSAVILAGGLGSRMGGVDKNRLEVGGRSMIERVVDVVSPLFGKIILAEGDEGRYQDMQGVIRVKDSASGRGPMAGILAGLSACPTEWAFVVAADMPLLDQSLIKKIAMLADENVNAVVPTFNGMMEPLHAAYHKRLLPEIQRRLEKDLRKTYELFDVQNTRFQELSADEMQHLSNVNNSDDLTVARQNSIG